MDAFTTYSFGTAGWLALQAVPLLLAPKLIVTMLSEDMHVTSALEVYFSRSLGLAFLAISLLHLLLTGAMPWSTTPQYTLESPNPYARPTTFISTVYHATLMFYCYMRYTQSGTSGFLLGIIGSACMAFLGLWAVLFADEKHISRRTGKDKRVSGFPFKNVDADAARGKKKF